MTIQKNQMSKHARFDRADRLAIIGATIGFGKKVLYERYSQKYDSWNCLMDTGAMLVWNSTKTKFVTGFVPSKTQLNWVCFQNPDFITEKIVENARIKFNTESHKLGFSQ